MHIIFVVVLMYDLKLSTCIIYKAYDYPVYTCMHMHI